MRCLQAQETRTVPPNTILDFLYGTAAYNRWRGEPIHDVVDAYPRNQPRHNDKDDDGGESTVDSDDPACEPTPPATRPRVSKREDVLARAMVKVSFVMMYVKGVTPQGAATQRAMQIQELVARNRSKVVAWMDTVARSWLCVFIFGDAGHYTALRGSMRASTMFHTMDWCGDQAVCEAKLSVVTIGQ